MAAETENAARERTATGSTTTRQMVMYGIAAYTAARLARDRRFQTSVIMSAIGLAVAKRAVKAGVKDVIVTTERYYLHVQPGWLHLRRRLHSHRRRRRRRAAK